MDDTVVFGTHGKVTDAKLGTVSGKGLHLLASYGVIDTLLLVAGCVMVGHCHHLLGAEYTNVLVSQCIECLWCCHLMAIEAVDIKLCGTVRYILYYVSIPNLIKESSGPTPSHPVREGAQI